jgi:hypothetical protein
MTFLKNDPKTKNVKCFFFVNSLILDLIVRDYILPAAEETLDRREFSS